MKYNLFYTSLILIVLVYFMIYYKRSGTPTKNKDVTKITNKPIGKDDISTLTDAWIEQVTVKNSPEGATQMFCPDGTLIGTVSQAKRTGIDIKKYFDFFAKKPGIKVLNKEYNINKVASDIYINTAFITWFWSGLNEPIVARMTFIFREKCLFQLHSSVLPEVNDEIFDIHNLP